VDTVGFWQVLLGSGRYCWVLVDTVGFWQVLVGSGRYWWVLVGSGGASKRQVVPD
jgi:hypothetical protein